MNDNQDYERKLKLDAVFCQEARKKQKFSLGFYGRFSAGSIASLLFEPTSRIGILVLLGSGIPDDGLCFFISDVHHIMHLCRRYNALVAL